MTRRPFATVVAKVAMAALAGTIAGIHLDLWASYGYRHIPTIGPLFLLNGIAGAVLAVACLATPSRIVALAWLSTAGYAVATLVAALISLNGKLFGFSESTGAPLLAPSLAVEGAAVLAGILLAAVHARGAFRRTRGITSYVGGPAPG